MSAKPRFLVNFNAEITTAYHSEPYQHDSGELISGNGFDGETVWKLPRHNATVTESATHYEGLSSCRMVTTVRNDGEKPLVVDTLSSVFVDGIGEEGPRWYEDRFIVHYAHMVWCGEAQWRHATLEDLGIYPTYNHSHQRTYIMRNVGSWTTCRYYPIIFLEDTYAGETHYFEIHSSSSWHIEVGARGYQDHSSVYVLLSGAHEDNDGWYVTLAPGESFTSVPAVYGCVRGGFEEAVAELTAYKRLTNLAHYPDGRVPVCFNDYMNCLWAQPSRNRLMPLIETAAEVGCEIFCIDAGWFGDPGVWSVHNGDYVPHDSLFGEGGLRGVIKEITSRGMRAGVWLELETVDSGSDFAKAHPEALLTRHNHPVGRFQCFMDFRLPVVRDHLMQIFNNLYDMGVRYVKNDYNHTTGATIDAPVGVSGALALDENAAAFMSFIDNVMATHPGFMIENCSSGAARCDHGSLSHFHLQSTSDQEYYDRNPSIIQGMLALMPPEKAGIWAYPYPVDIEDRIEQMEVYPIVNENVKKMIPAQADGRQTAFNMVNGMMGVMYLSGRICYADEHNLKLIREAISIYKENRDILAGAVPVYPQGQIRLSGRGHTSLGLLNRAAGKLLLAVWQVHTDETQTMVDLTSYMGENATVSRAYPALDGFAGSLKDGHLLVIFPKGNCAAYFEINL